MSVPDPYKVLQVDSEAEVEVIEAAYRRLARKYHPDVSPDPESQARMVRINQAWELLRDPSKRAAVDRARLRSAGAAARVAAADAKSRTGTRASGGRDDRGRSSGPFVAGRDADATARGGARPWRRLPPAPRSSSRSPRVTGPPGGRMPVAATTPRRWARPRGTGRAGPPPGRPSGSVLNFGRYAGWSLGEIARSDLEYLEWLDRTPIGRIYQVELDEILRAYGRRVSASPEDRQQRGLFRRR